MPALASYRVAGAVILLLIEAVGNYSNNKTLHKDHPELENKYNASWFFSALSCLLLLSAYFFPGE